MHFTYGLCGWKGRQIDEIRGTGRCLSAILNLRSRRLLCFEANADRLNVLVWVNELLVGSKEV